MQNSIKKTNRCTWI